MNVYILSYYDTCERFEVWNRVFSSIENAKAYALRDVGTLFLDWKGLESSQLWAEVDDDHNFYIDSMILDPMDQDQ